MMGGRNTCCCNSRNLKRQQLPAKLLYHNLLRLSLLPLLLLVPLLVCGFTPLYLCMNRQSSIVAI
jgi:cell division protein FtsL